MTARKVHNNLQVMQHSQVSLGQREEEKCITMEVGTILNNTTIKIHTKS